MKRGVLVGLMLAIVGAVFWYLNQNHHDPQQFAVSARQEVERLVVKKELRDGDIIFQESLSRQSRAIQLATGSRYSHCGIIYRRGDSYEVFEAVQPVRSTPLVKWIARGKDGHIVVKRLINSDQVLTPNSLARMKSIGKQFVGKNYDLTFEWSDEKMYCSEIIWKIYQRVTGIELGRLQKLRDFDLSNEIVAKKMKERYGNHIPLDETVISPASIFESEHLLVIYSN